jgi:hypothetical protein
MWYSVRLVLSGYNNEWIRQLRLSAHHFDDDDDDT